MIFGNPVELYPEVGVHFVNEKEPTPIKIKDDKPVPLMPRDQAISIRIMDIADAIIRYASVYKSVPVDWLEELCQLNNDLEVLNNENEDGCE